MFSPASSPGHRRAGTAVPVVASASCRKSCIGSTTRAYTSAARNAADDVALVLEGGDDVGEGCDGFGPVAAAVVHEQDAARPDVGAGGRLDDVLGAGSAPVPSVYSPQHLTKTLSAQDPLHGG